ncbi:Peroxisomal targeting signal receptor [Sphaceloma murrayae]|uniref:Peroxisomal targeting signal receptor n=1 Tax=Sphaceloma murrayae TaxID=2082308 RepID=A0A2K1R282_9PEZI|nr:Peroxisomal targeting signal receptor [Sphaceloma murrayae]
MAPNGTSLPSRPAATNPAVPNRADELDDLLAAVQPLLHTYISSADTSASAKSTGHGLQTPGSGPRTALVEHHPPQKLASLFALDLPSSPGGKPALVSTVTRLLQYSVNTWDQGFLDKLYASTNPVGVVSELVLAVLNTNVHVYTTSPALTVVEKETCRAIARLFGFQGGHVGGVSQPGGSAGNGSSIVVARNALFPETKTEGLAGRKFVLFTSAHGHYSLEKAAQMYGFGSGAVRGVPVDAKGRMRVEELGRMITEAREKGETPFYVNATAGTTVLGSFDPIEEMAEVCKKEGLWLHVDGSWGGPVVFSKKQREKVKGIEKVDSVAFTPHKMLGVPLTCSFLIVKDVRVLQKAMTLPAGYLFHDLEADDTPVESEAGGHEEKESQEFWDLADLTPQCGRKGDALKMALGWIYYGSEGYERLVDAAFETATYMATEVQKNKALTLVSENPPPCLQVCFYYNKQTGEGAKEQNSKITAAIAKKLVPRGFMIDYAPGEEGKFFRVVVNGQTMKGTVDGILRAIEDIGKDITV